MADIVTHLGQNLNWVAFKNGHNRFTVTITSSGSAFDISTYVFALSIRTPGGTTNKLQLTEASGITNGGAAGTLIIDLTQTQASTTLPRDLYFYELTYTKDLKVYPFMQGNLSLSSESNPSSTKTSVSVSVSLAGSSVSASITLAGSSGGGAWGEIEGTLADQTDLQTALDAKLTKLTSFNRQTDDYTLVLGDAFKVVEMNKATAVSLTIPPNSSVAFEIGTIVYGSQYGAGTVTFQAGVGVTINSSSGANTTPSQYSIVAVQKVGEDEWYLFNGSAPTPVVDWTASLNETGFSATSIKESWYRDDGVEILMTIILVGTSNAVELQFDLPVAANMDYGTGGFNQPVQIANSGTVALGSLSINGGSTTAVVKSTIGGAAFTGSGTKSVRATFRYRK